MAAGSFEGPPYEGERLPTEDDSAAGEWAMAHGMLRNAGMAPPWIESDKEARRLLAQIERLMERAPRTSPLSRGSERRNLERLVDDANRAILRVNAEAPTPAQHRPPLDPAAHQARLETAFESG